MSSDNRVSIYSKAPILTYIPFTGSEKKCWDCGGNRQVVVRMDRRGNFVGYGEVCDK